MLADSVFRIDGNGSAQRTAAQMRADGRKAGRSRVARDTP